MDIKANSHMQNIDSSNSRLTQGQILQIMEDQAHLREIGWKALRETLDWFAEKVNLIHSDLEQHPDYSEGRCANVRVISNRRSGGVAC